MMPGWTVQIGMFLGVSLISSGLWAQSPSSGPGLGVVRLAESPRNTTPLNFSLFQQNPAEAISPSDIPPPVQGIDIPGEPRAVPAEDGVAVQQDSLTPEQSLELSSVVSTVNIAMEEIGTGLLPEPAKKYTDMERLWLPDGVDRGATFKSVTWRPSMVFHNPLYYEDAMLERHGQTRWGCAQPLASGGKFFAELALLPYTATLQPYRQTRFVLGQYRAGSRAPVLKDNLPWDKRAAAVETAFWGGFFWALPTPW